jgi:hypothetical protein
MLLDRKFLELGSPEQKQNLGSLIVKSVIPLSLQMYGCRVVQKALEVINKEQQREIVMQLEGNVVKLVKDQNGNHVIQKAIECVPPDLISFICQSFIGQVYLIIALIHTLSNCHFLYAGIQSIDTSLWYVKNGLFLSLFGGLL